MLYFFSMESQTSFVSDFRHECKHMDRVGDTTQLVVTGMTSQCVCFIRHSPAASSSTRSLLERHSPSLLASTPTEMECPYLECSAAMNTCTKSSLFLPC